MPEMYKRKWNDSWYVQIGRKQHNLGRDEKAAKLNLAKLIAEKRPPALDAPVVTLFDRFLDWCKVNRSPRSHEFYQDAINSFRQSIGNRLTVDDLRPYHVTTWLDVRYATASNTYKNNLIRGVQRPFNWAVKEQYIDRNPIKGIEKPQQTPRQVFIDKTQWKVLLKKVPDEEFRDYLTILWESGCRPQEARKLEARTMHGSRAIFDLVDSKGKKKRRTIYFNATAMKIIERLMKEHPIGPLLLNTKGKRVDERCRQLPIPANGLAL